MKYLISRTDAIGDNLLTMPMAQVIKEMDENAEIAFITSKIAEPLYENNPYIDHIYCLDKTENLFLKFKKLFKIMKEFQADYFFYVGGSQIPLIIAYLKRIAYRGGVLSKWTTFLFLNKGVRQMRSSVARHEIKYNVDLLSNLNGFDKIKNKNYLPVINLNEEKEAIASFYSELISHGLEKKEYIFIHPGMTGHSLNWSSRNFGRLVYKINLEYPNQYNFIISYTSIDNKYLKIFRNEIEQLNELKKNIYYFDGSIKGLKHYFLILKEAKAFIGPSTGTTHIAAALKVPLIGIYSPLKSQSAIRWGAVGENQTINITPNVVCGEETKCIEDACPYFECMKKIEVDMVFQQFKKIMEKV